MKIMHAFFVAVLGLSVGLSGCKAGPTMSTSFVKSEVMANDPSLPFHLVWKSPTFDKSKYKKLYVAPVNIDYMFKNTEWEGSAQAGDFQKDVEELGTYFREAVKKAFREDTKARFAVLNIPSTSEDTLILEMAITEIVPSKVVLNALGYAPFGIGLAIKGVRALAKDRSTAAFEARIKDAATGRVVAMIADCEAEQNAVVSVRGLTWFSHVYVIMDKWAEQLVKLANRRPGQVIEDTSPFTLKPW